MTRREKLGFQLMLFSVGLMVNEMRVMAVAGWIIGNALFFWDDFRKDFIDKENK